MHIYRPVKCHVPHCTYGLLHGPLRELCPIRCLRKALQHIHRAPKAHFLPKKVMMLPWPGLPAFFVPALPLPFDDWVDGNLAFFGGGSSSEKDSHAASSFVTGKH
jgi:hypothetical protein